MEGTPTRPATLLRTWMLQSLLVAGTAMTVLYFVVGAAATDQETGLARDLAERASYHVFREIEDRWLSRHPDRIVPANQAEFDELERLFVLHRESLEIERIVWFDDKHRIVHCGDFALTGVLAEGDEDLVRSGPGTVVAKLIPAGQRIHGGPISFEVPVLEVYVEPEPDRVHERLRGHVIELYLDATDVVQRVDASRRVTLLSALCVGAALFVAVVRLLQRAQRQLTEQNQRLRSLSIGLEREVEARTQELIRTRRLADVGTLAAGLAHEINNPLAVIGASAQGLLDRLRRRGDALLAERSDFEEYLRAIEGETFRCKRITESLLSFARTRPPTLRRVDLRELAAEVAALMRPLAEARRQEIAAPAPDAGEPLPVEVAPEEIKQLLVNLVSNAFDAGGAGQQVEVTCGRAGDHAFVAVRDHGRGLSAVGTERIFEPFFTTKPPGEGVGMGLSISRQIAEMHRGRLIAEVPSDGVGARFRCELPLAGAVAPQPEGKR
ncbi:MAG: hypothetical protein JNL90_07965 [Planctomycetes bacterium]|nr:hypothetical protein [Planctomycetota bacterium]